MEQNQQLDDLEILLDTGTDQEIRDFLRILHPADVADLIEDISDSGRTRVLSLLDSATAAEALSETESPYRRRIVRGMGHEQLADIIEEMESDDAADLLGDLSAEDAREIISEMEPSESADVKRLLKYPEDTAGGIMQTEFVSLPTSATVSEAIDEIRAKRREVRDLHNVFVTDGEGRLKGLVPLRRLLLADTGDSIEKIMDANVTAANVNIDQEEVASLFRKYDFVSLPVIDSDNKLLGRIMVDDIVDVLDEEADEDFMRLAGSAHEDVTSLSLSRSVGARFPWLLVTYMGESVTALVIAYFRGAFIHLLLFVPFLPIIVGMAGNVGSQSATIIVRGLATGRVDVHKVWPIAFKEMRVGAILGLIYGVIVGLMTGYLHDGFFSLGVIVGLSLTIVVMMSAIMGVLLPILFERLGKDPALATAPFIASSMDLLGAAVYYGIAMNFYTGP